LLTFERITRNHALSVTDAIAGKKEKYFRLLGKSGK